MLAYASNMSQRPNIYDVARVAGVSRTVVSLVTNGKADQYRIARETQDRVRAAVRQTGYVPNFFIRDMYLKRRVISQAGGAGAVTDPVKVAAVINQALASAGYQMKVSSLSADQNASLLLLLAPTTPPSPSSLPSSVAPICDRSPSSASAGEGGDSSPPSSPEPVIAEPPPEPLLPSSPASSTTTPP
jgi:hypothetical protein